MEFIMKLSTTHAMALCALTLLVSQQAWADAKPGPDAQLTVKGSIMPGNCSVDLSNNKQFVFPDTPADSIVDEDAGTPIGLAEDEMLLQIDCHGKATQVAFGVKDMREESRAPNLKVKNPTAGGALMGTTNNDFGLGMNGIG